MLNFRTHSELKDKHAFLGASKHHWINYDIEKMERHFANQFAAQTGTRIHDVAAELIRLGIRMGRSSTTLNMYVNDAIGFRMTPEQALMYSYNCFGTADAISFHKRVLRVHDLKTGTHPGSPHQLEIYCALFCLEYNINPFEIEMITRIYQLDEKIEFLPDPADISAIMQKIVEFDKRIEELKAAS